MWITFDQILEMKSTSSSVSFFRSVGLIYKLCICFPLISELGFVSYDTPSNRIECKNCPPQKQKKKRANTAPTYDEEAVSRLPIVCSTPPYLASDNIDLPHPLLVASPSLGADRRARDRCRAQHGVLPKSNRV